MTRSSWPPRAVALVCALVAGAGSVAPAPCGDASWCAEAFKVFGGIAEKQPDAELEPACEREEFQRLCQKSCGLCPGLGAAAGETEQAAGTEPAASSKPVAAAAIEPTADASPAAEQGGAAPATAANGAVPTMATASEATGAAAGDGTADAASAAGATPQLDAVGAVDVADASGAGDALLGADNAAALSSTGGESDAPAVEAQQEAASGPAHTATDADAENNSEGEAGVGPVAELTVTQTLHENAKLLANGFCDGPAKCSAQHFCVGFEGNKARPVPPFPCFLREGR